MWRARFRQPQRREAASPTGTREAGKPSERRRCSAESGKMSRCLPGEPGEEGHARTGAEHRQRQEGLEAASHAQGRAGWERNGQKLEEVDGGQFWGP